jgi:23S rRNA pseudouridine2605 synthase
MEERLQKILARAGYGSRRANEELIEAGRVRVNGKVAELGAKADPQRDTITLDGKTIGKVMPEFVYVALHKPRGVLSDEDPNEPNPRTTVRDLVPIPGHLFAVGRLDLESEGLILLTNDGELANRLTHPRYEHEKEYRVQLAVRPDEEQLATWRRGVVMEDGTRTLPATVTLTGFAGKGAWMTIVMKEGRKRQIREVGKRLGLPVFRILRVRIGSLELSNLRPKEWRYLTPDEVDSLKTLQNRNKAPRPVHRSFNREHPPKPGRRSGGPQKQEQERSPNTSRPPRSGPSAPASRSGRSTPPTQPGGRPGSPSRAPHSSPPSRSPRRPSTQRRPK